MADESLPSPIPLPDSETGQLQVQRICPSGMEDGFSIFVEAWGPTRTGFMSYHRSCTEEQTWRVRPGTYTVCAYRIDFCERSKTKRTEMLLRQHGTQVTIRKGHTSKISVPVWSSNDVIKWDLEWLRRAAS